jgi:hypothetical protein
MDATREVFLAGIRVRSLFLRTQPNLISGHYKRVIPNRFNSLINPSKAQAQCVGRLLLVAVKLRRRSSASPRRVKDGLVSCPRSSQKKSVVRPTVRKAEEAFDYPVPVAPAIASLPGNGD